MKFENFQTNQRVYLLAILLVTTILVAPQLLREYPLGHDPYYYLAHANDPQPGMPPTFFYFAAENPIGIAFLLTAILILLFHLIALECGSEPNSILHLVLILAPPALYLRSAMLEDDLLGVPLCLLAIYLYLKDNRYKPAALLLLFAGALIAWRGCLLFILLLIFDWITERWNTGWLLLPSMTAVAAPIQGAAYVGENQAGFLFIPIVLLGLFLGFMNYRYKKVFVVKWAIWFFALGIISAKWLWLASFPLAILLADYLKNEPKRNTFIIVAVGLGIFLGSMFVINTEPTSQQFADIQEIVKLCPGEINNEWWVGHWLTYLGGNPRYTNLHPTELVYVPGEAECHLTNRTLDYPILKDFGWIKLYQGSTAYR